MATIVGKEAKKAITGLKKEIRRKVASEVALGLIPGLKATHISRAVIKKVVSGTVRQGARKPFVVQKRQIIRELEERIREARKLAKKK